MERAEGLFSDGKYCFGPTGSCLQWHSCPICAKPCQDVAHPRAARGPLAGFSCCWLCARAHGLHGHPVTVTSALFGSEMQRVRQVKWQVLGGYQLPLPPTSRGGDSACPAFLAMCTAWWAVLWGHCGGMGRRSHSTRGVPAEGFVLHLPLCYGSRWAC